MSSTLNANLTSDEMNVLHGQDSEQGFSPEESALLAAIRRQLDKAAQARKAMEECEPVRQYLQAVADLDDAMAELPLEQAEILRRLAGAELGKTIQDDPGVPDDFDVDTLEIRTYESETLNGRLRIYNDMAEAYLAGDKNKFWELNKMLPEWINDNMSNKLQLKIGRAMSKAKEANDDDAEERMSQIRPMLACLLKHIKESEGVDGLLEYHYNMVEAEERYGKDWLNR